MPCSIMEWGILYLPTVLLVCITDLYRYKLSLLSLHFYFPLKFGGGRNNVYLCMRITETESEFRYYEYD